MDCLPQVSFHLLAQRNCSFGGSGFVGTRVQCPGLYMRTEDKLLTV
jgi:hypothetical protein